MREMNRQFFRLEPYFRLMEQREVVGRKRHGEGVLQELASDGWIQVRRGWMADEADGGDMSGHSDQGWRRYFEKTKECKWWNLIRKEGEEWNREPEGDVWVVGDGKPGVGRDGWRVDGDGVRVKNKVMGWGKASRKKGVHGEWRWGAVWERAQVWYLKLENSMFRMLDYRL